MCGNTFENNVKQSFLFENSVSKQNIAKRMWLEKTLILRRARKMRWVASATYHCENPYLPGPETMTKQ